jgi:hypothetical protein
MREELFVCPSAKGVHSGLRGDPKYEITEIVYRTVKASRRPLG